MTFGPAQRAVAAPIMDCVSIVPPDPDAVPPLVIDELVVPLVGGIVHDRGFELAVRIAERFGLPVRLVHVELSDDAGAVSLEGGAALEEIRGRFAAEYPSISVTDELLDGDDVAAALADTLTPTSAVVMTSTRAGAAPPASIAEAVTRRWSGPVVLLGEDTPVPHLSAAVVVALDGSPVAEHAIGPALRLALAVDAPVWLVQVVDHVTSEKVLELRDAGESVSESAYLQSVAADWSRRADRRVGWQIVHDDDPVRGVLTFARDQGAGFVVAGTHGASGLARLNFGSVCMGLVRRGTHPVVVVRPDLPPEAALPG